MEILIIGGALVALMVFVSTRIKKNSAKAFDRENIETENFSIYKPDGYIIPVKRNSEFALEAYSKDKGEGTAGKISRSWATLRVYKNGNFKEICLKAKQNAANIISDENANDNNLNYYFMHGEGEESGVGKEIFYKIIENPKRGEVYELQGSILNEYLEIFSSKISAILQSFTVKTGQIKKVETNQFIGTNI